MEHNFSQEQVNEIIKMYKDGVDIDTIIEYFDTDEHNIRLVLKGNSIDRVYNTFTVELNQRLIHLYRDLGYVQSKICYDLLVSEMGIKKILARNNIPKRTPSECNKKYNRNSNYFDVIDSENKAYFLGLIYADGNNYCNHEEGKYSITLSLQERDGYLIEKFAEEIEYGGNVYLDKLSLENPKHKDQVRIVINDEHMSKQLESLGVVNNKSLVLKFPDFIPEQYLRHFIRGFFDGDGGVYYYEKDYKLTSNTTSTFEFLSAIQSILRKKLDCNSNIHKPKPYLESNTYVLQTSATKSTVKYLSWLYDDCEIKMMRKFNIFRTKRIDYEAKMKSRKNNELDE